MISPKLISSKVCVEYFYSHTGTANELMEDDIRLWTSELQEIIGNPLQFIPKVIGVNANAAYDFKNYSVPLPCDFYKLMPSGLSVDGYPVLWRQNAFHYLMDGDCCDLDNLNSTMLTEFQDQFGNTFAPEIPGEAGTSNFNRDVRFDITDGRIVFNVKQGKCCMAYWSLPIDNEGYIMIPDTAKYKRAVTDYLIWNNDYILWRQGVLSDKVYQVSNENKVFSIAAASMELKVPDENQTQVIQNSMVRLIPLINSYNTFFQSLGKEEKLRIR